MTLCTLTVACTLFTLVLSYGGDYVPKAYYKIGQNGEKSELIYFRSKRAVELFPLFRMKRGVGSQSSASSYSTSSAGSAPTNFPASAGFNAGTGAGFVPSFAPDDDNTNFGFSGPNLGYHGPILFSRFGEDTGTGVKVSGAAAGPRAAFSSSSSSIDSNGKIQYSVKSGKY